MIKALILGYFLYSCLIFSQNMLFAPNVLESSLTNRLHDFVCKQHDIVITCGNVNSSILLYENNTEIMNVFEICDHWLTGADSVTKYPKECDQNVCHFEIGACLKVDMCL